MARLYKSRMKIAAPEQNWPITACLTHGATKNPTPAYSREPSVLPERITKKPSLNYQEAIAFLHAFLESPAGEGLLFSCLGVCGVGLFGRFMPLGVTLV